MFSLVNLLVTHRLLARLLMIKRGVLDEFVSWCEASSLQINANETRERGSGHTIDHYHSLLH